MTRLPRLAVDRAEGPAQRCRDRVPRLADRHRADRRLDRGRERALPARRARDLPLDHGRNGLALAAPARGQGDCRAARLADQALLHRQRREPGAADRHRRRRSADHRTLAEAARSQGRGGRRRHHRAGHRSCRHARHGRHRTRRRDRALRGNRVPGSDRGRLFRHSSQPGSSSSSRSEPPRCSGGSRRWRRRCA